MWKHIFQVDPRNFESYFKPGSILIFFGNCADLSCHVFYFFLAGHEHQNILSDKINIWRESRNGSNLAGASEWIVKIVDSMARNQSSFGSDICLRNDWQHISKKILLFLPYTDGMLPACYIEHWAAPVMSKLISIHCSRHHHHLA